MEFELGSELESYIRENILSDRKDLLRAFLYCKFEVPTGVFGTQLVQLANLVEILGEQPKEVVVGIGNGARPEQTMPGSDAIEISRSLFESLHRDEEAVSLIEEVVRPSA